MKGGAARALMALAWASLGEGRRDWAAAMEAEFEAAREDGKALAFAWGCVIGAWRDLPAHEGGRFAMASRALALALLVPAALLAAGLLGDFPHSLWGSIAQPGFALLSDANRAALPSLAALALLLSGAHLRLAWLVLERDWEGAAAAVILIAAANVTLAIFSAVVFLEAAPALAQGILSAVELAAVFALARWDVRASGERFEPRHA
jgi:hypothetical protein